MIKKPSCARAQGPKKIRRILGKLEGPNGQCILRGKLCVPPGAARPRKPLFRAVGEKLPYDMVTEVRDNLRDKLKKKVIKGIYLAHDSKGVVRYAGRGQIFGRLLRHQREHPAELKYFSFYVIDHKEHERDIETLCIRVAGPQLCFNIQKKREDTRAGAVRDWAAGTLFYQRRRGRELKKK